MRQKSTGKQKKAKDNLDLIRNIVVYSIPDGLNGELGLTDYSIDSINAAVCFMGITSNLCN